MGVSRRRRSSSESSSSSSDDDRERTDDVAQYRRPSPPRSPQYDAKKSDLLDERTHKHGKASYDDNFRREGTRGDKQPHDHRETQRREWERKRAEREQRAEYLATRRERRAAIAEEGVKRCWANSPEPPSRKSECMRVDTDDDVSDDGSDEVKSVASDASVKVEKKKKHKKDKKKKKEKKKKKRKHEGDSDEWVEVTKESIEKRRAEGGSDDEDAVVGPKLPKLDVAEADIDTRVNYGKDLRPGEGAAMAAYVAAGERIPRRGEIGLQSDDILMYEKMGYVMSGSRHRRMEATRIRKENQIYSVEEKRMLNTLTQEERKKKESHVLQQFKTLVQQKKQQ